jgi:hypothetical protein
VRRRPIGGAPRRPVGQFAGNPPDPSNPTGAVVRELLDGMSGDPGIRLASSRGKRTFRAGGLNLQTFPIGVTSPASDEALATLPITAGTRSRALGQFRGTPDMSWPTEGSLE